jgi:hypothetical protein
MRRSFSFGGRKFGAPDQGALNRLLGAYREIARGEIVKEFGRGSCIPATRITIDVLHHYKVEAVAMPVKMILYNASLRGQLLAGNDPQYQDLEEWCKRTGACSVGLGYSKKQFNGPEYQRLITSTQQELLGADYFPLCDLEIGEIILIEGRGFRVCEGPGGLPLLDPVHVGHVVAYLPAHNLLIDASADQLNRPEDEIELPGVMTLIAPPGLLDAGFESESGGCFVFYRRADNYTYQESQIWFDNRRTKPTRAAIIAAIDERLR